MAALVRNLFRERRALTFVDAACGEMTWMPPFLRDLSSHFPGGMNCVGADNVEDLIAANTAAFRREGKIEYTFARENPGLVARGRRVHGNGSGRWTGKG